MSIKYFKKGKQWFAEGELNGKMRFYGPYKNKDEAIKVVSNYIKMSNNAPSKEDIKRANKKYNTDYGEEYLNNMLFRMKNMDRD